MNIKQWTVVVLLLVELVACKPFIISGNISEKAIKDNSEWQYTPSSYQTFDILNIWIGANYEAASIQINKSQVNASLTTGSAYIAFTLAPFSFLSYFSGEYVLNHRIGDGQSFSQLDVTTASGYVGTGYLRLEEVAPNGTIVATKSLRWALPFQEGFSWAATDSDTTNGTLNYITFTGTDNSSPTVVNITFMVASVAGIVTENIPIVPNSLESVVSIGSYPYQDLSNSLSLVLGVGTGGLKFSSNRTLYSSGSNVYFSLSDHAIIGGNSSPVKVSGYNAGDLDVDIGNSNFEAQLKARYADSWTFSIVKVTFPAGANNITYDPTMGNGASVQDYSSASAIIFVPLALIAVAVMLVLA